jgi:hypothetical protein
MDLYFILSHRVLCVVMDTDPISSLSISSATSPIFATYETFLGLSDFYIVMAFRAVLDPLSSCCSCRLCNCLLCTVLVDLQVYPSIINDTCTATGRKLLVTQSVVTTASWRYRSVVVLVVDFRSVFFVEMHFCLGCTFTGTRFWVLLDQVSYK